MSETLIFKHSVTNSPHIRSAGSFDVTLIGTSNTNFTEQLLTPIKIPVGAMRGSPKVLLQMEILDESVLVEGKGVCGLVTKDVTVEGFQVIAVHNIPDAESVHVRITWFAFGYESAAAATYELTRQNNQIVPLVYSEVFAGVIGSITLSRMPIHDSTLIVWSDRIPMFYGRDFTVIENVITLNVPLAGVEAVVVTFTTRTSEIL